MFLAAIAFLPTAANAHSGHSHAAAPTEHVIAASVDVDQEQAAKPAQEVLTRFAVIAGVSDHRPEGQSECAGSCCKSAMACCVVILSHPDEPPLPQGAATRLAFPSGAAWADFAPDGLRRPPKSFA